MSLLLIFWRKSVHYIAGLCRVLALLVSFWGAAGLLAQNAYEFSLLAGSGETSSSIDGQLGDATFQDPYDLTLDSAGNLYVVEWSNHTVRKISPTGTVTTLAGKPGVAGSSDGSGVNARFDHPNAIAVDVAGNVFVADTFNHTIRRITPDGVVSTWAGAAGAQGSQDGTGSVARFYSPSDLCVDAVGNLYVADLGNFVIRKIALDRTVTTLAGQPGSSGSADGSGTDARFSAIRGLCLGPDGNLYVADTNNRIIRKVTPSGVVTTVAGVAFEAALVDGPASVARFINPTGIISDADGNLYVSETGTNPVIRLVSPDGTVETLAGGSGQRGWVDGVGVAAYFNLPWGLTIDGAGNVFIADVTNHAIRKLEPSGAVSTYAGGTGAPGDVDGLAGAARFYTPRFMSVGADGHLYVADTSNNQIRKITVAGEVTTLAEGVGQSQVRGVAVDSAGNVFASDASARIYKVTPSGAVSLWAGGSSNGYADGTGGDAKFSGPYGLAVDAMDNLYVAERNNSLIRKVSPTGVVTTVTGTDYWPIEAGFTDGVARRAQFRNPHGVDVGPDGAIYVADFGNHTVRKLSLDGRVVTLAGVAGQIGSADGVGAEARFNSPSGIAVDVHGYVYVTDSGNGTLRGISPDGEVRTLGGTAGTLSFRTGTGADAGFAAPYGVAVDRDGRVFVSDASYQTILMATNQSTPAITDSPADQVVAEGERVMLSVSTTGGYVNFQWRKNGVPLAGEVQSSLTIDSAAVGDSGSYDVVVTNLLGSIESMPADLEVQPIPVITAFTAPDQVVAGGSFALSVTASGTGILHYQWQRNGLPIPGATSRYFTVTHAEAEHHGWYRVLVTDDYGTRASPVAFVLVAPSVTEVVAWGSNNQGQLTVPSELDDAIALAAGDEHVLALRADGTVVAWGSNSWGQAQVPASLEDVVAVAAGATHSLALKRDGTVVAWGDNRDYQCAVPTGLQNVVAVAACYVRSTALLADGTVIEWGGSDLDVISKPADLAGVVSVAAGRSHSLALHGDGSVTGWGYDYYGQATPSAGLSAVSAMAAGSSFSLAILSDNGAVTGWGLNDLGQLDVPANLVDVKMIGAGANHALALRADGTAVGWGGNDLGQTTMPEGLADIWSVAAGGNSSFALVRKPEPPQAPVLISHPSVQNVAVGETAVFSVAAMGFPTPTYQWYHDGVAIEGATEATYSINDVQAEDAGRYWVAVTNDLGTTMSAPAKLRIPGLLWAAGDNSFGEFGGEYPITQIHTIASDVIDAAVGSEFSVYVTSDGDLWATGNGVGWSDFGGIGDYSPYARILDSGVSKVAANGAYFLYLKTDGRLFGAGRDSNGQLGRNQYTQPAMGEIASGVIDMQAGNGFSVYLKSNGELWGSGLNTSGQLGDGSTTSRFTFSLITTGVKRVSTDGSHVLFIKTDDTLWGVGNNIYGALGDGTFTNRSTPVQIASNVVECAAGGAHSLYITSDGTLWGVGWNAFGQLGDGSTTNRNMPITISSGVSHVFGGSQGTSFIKTDGTLWATGRNSHGQLGNGQTDDILTPVHIASDIVKVASSTFHTLLIKGDGTLLTVGENNYGQLGIGTTTYRTTPMLMAEDAVDVSSGNSHTLFLKPDGTLWGVGRNNSGQLGDAHEGYSAEPVEIAADVTAFSAAAWLSLYVTSDGTLWGMGDNDYGQLGLGHTDTVTTPAVIADGVADVAAGVGHSLFLKTDGSLWAMGYNAWGQLGDGTLLQRLSPVQIASGVTAMAVGQYHSLFVKTDGTLWAMGMNDSGQLGDGTITDRSVPVLVASNVCDVAVGLSFSLFRKTDGSLWGMGGNSDGLIVDDEEDTKLLPSKVAERVANYAAGSGYIFYVTADDLMAFRGSTSRGESGFGYFSYSPLTSAVLGRPLALIRTGHRKTYYIQPENPAATLPAITKQPAGGIYPEADNVSLTVVATEDWPFPGVDYQWRKDGIAIPGARNARLYLPNIQASAAGSYDVVVRNSAGSVVSDTVEVSVTQQPNAAAVTLYAPNKVYTGAPQGITIIETDPYGLEVAVTYDGSPDIPVAVGTYNVVVTVTEPGYTGSASGSFSITKATQSLFFSSIANQAYSDAPIELSAAASSDLPVTFMVVSGPATISGNQLTLTGIGTVTVRASQVGSENYLAATPVERSFTVTANGDSWAAEHFTSDELADPLISGPSADPDADGLTNLLEYALGLDPRSSDTTGLPEAGSTATDWTYTYTRPADRDDLTYAVEVSTDLMSWTTTGVTLTPIGADDDEETWQATYPLSSATNLFFRLKIEQP